MIYGYVRGTDKECEVQKKMIHKRCQIHVDIWRECGDGNVREIYGRLRAGYKKTEETDED